MNTINPNPSAAGATTAADGYDAVVAQLLLDAQSTCNCGNEHAPSKRCCCCCAASVYRPSTNHG